MSIEALNAAIQKREHDYQKAIDRLRRIAPEADEDEVHTLTSRFSEAIFLLACLRRLLPGRDVNEIYKAFGAPGDFGYETPIGSALDKLYREPREPKAVVVDGECMQDCDALGVPCPTRQTPASGDSGGET